VQPKIGSWQELTWWVLMEADRTSLSSLERLAASAKIRDRAFAAGALGLARTAAEPELLTRLYARIEETARREHAALRARIRSGSMSSDALLAMLTEAPLDIRDHLIEEILGIAYPPLDRAPAERDVNRDFTSSLQEILFVLEHGQLGPDSSFVDLGSGLGKVVMLVALLTSAQVWGLELDSQLTAGARTAARSLGLERTHFLQGDIRDAPLPAADAYYMFIPFLGSAAVVERLAPIAAQRKILLFSQTLDLAALPWLKATGARGYWLEMYESVG
jgi:SAM-dependent methyltransferase